MLQFDHPTDAERDIFCFATRFPNTSSGLSDFIFSKTGFSNTTNPLGLRGWYLLNRSLNEGMKLEQDDETIRTLSLMDDALSHVRRFAGMPHMHEIAADSTAAHSHQVMRVVDEVVRAAFPRHMPPVINTLRKEAILGAWVHDMGEIVTELTTATDMFNMDKNEREAISDAKDAFEHEMVGFALDLASYCLKQSNPEMFAEEIVKLREAIQDTPQTLNRIKVLRDTITTRREQLGLTRSEVGAHLWDVYQRTESPSEKNFLHPFVKTLECVEGQRYLQRNAKTPPGSTLFTDMSLATSHEIVSGVRRCERRLPLLMQEAEQVNPENWAYFDKLARQTAHYTYGSIARQFTPNSGEEYVSVAPPYIHRNPDLGSEPFTDELLPEARHTVRARHHGLLQKQRDAQPQDTLNVPIWTREEAGKVYRAAQQAMLQLSTKTPTVGTCLLSHVDTPQLPERITHELNRARLVGDRSAPHAGRTA